jgi:chorismate mutase
MEIKDLRVKLDQMTERIVSRLKDRSRYRLNESVYKPGAHPKVAGKSISFLEYALEGLENYHASLGRFRHQEQQPFIGHFPPHVHAQRKALQTPIAQAKISVKGDILPFYVAAVMRFCELGEDPNTYGETVYCDADLVLLLNERVNLGRVVAETKMQENPELNIIHDEGELEKELRFPKREQEVLQQARKIAQRYLFPEGIAESFFKWIIDETVKVEVAYVKQRQQFPD